MLCPFLFTHEATFNDIVYNSPSHSKEKKDSIIPQIYKQLHISLIYQNFITAGTDKKSAFSKDLMIDNQHTQGSVRNA